MVAILDAIGSTVIMLQTPYCWTSAWMRTFVLLWRQAALKEKANPQFWNVGLFLLRSHGLHDCREVWREGIAYCDLWVEPQWSFLMNDNDLWLTVARTIVRRKLDVFDKNSILMSSVITATRAWNLSDVDCDMVALLLMQASKGKMTRRNDYLADWVATVWWCPPTKAMTKLALHIAPQKWTVDFQAMKQWSILRQWGRLDATVQRLGRQLSDPEDLDALASAIPLQKSRLSFCAALADHRVMITRWSRLRRTWVLCVVCRNNSKIHS